MQDTIIARASSRVLQEASWSVSMLYDCQRLDEGRDLRSRKKNKIQDTEQHKEKVKGHNNTKNKTKKTVNYNNSEAKKKEKTKLMTLCKT